MIRNIQVLRALAAFLVVFVHVDLLLATVGLRPFGFGGVDLFFVISGFIMVYVTKGRPTTPVSFMRQRILRIVPIYWVMTLGLFLLAMVKPDLLQTTKANLADLLKSLFFIPYQRADLTVRPFLFVGWTLNYEMFFYVVFSVALTAGRYLRGILGVMIALTALVVFGAVFKPQQLHLAFYSQPIVLEFVIGMLIALTVERIPSRAPAPAARILALGCGVLAFVGLAVLPILSPKLPSLLTAGIPAAIVLYAAVALERWGWSVRNRWILILGDASYVIYLSHPFVTQVASKVAMRFLHPQGLLTWGLLALTLALVGAAGVCLHFAVERPLSKLARRLIGGHRDVDASDARSKGPGAPLPPAALESSSES